MNNRKKAIIKLIFLLAVIVVIPTIIYLEWKDTYLTKEWLRGLPVLLEQHSQHAIIALISMQILQIIICFLPGQPIQLAASYVFGGFGGYLISIIGAVIGSFIVFYLARFLGSDALYLFFGEEKVENYRRKLNSGKGYLIVLLIYLIPGFPKDIVAYVAGISRMDFIPFLILSTIGRSPGMIGSLLIGHFLKAGNYTAIAIVAVICAIILLICWCKRAVLISLLDNVESIEEHRREKHGKERI